MISLTQSHTARRQDIAPKKFIGFKNCDHPMFGRKALVDESGVLRDGWMLDLPGWLLGKLLEMQIQA